MFRHYKLPFLPLLLFFISCTIIQKSEAQKESPIEKEYFIVYPKSTVVRLFLSQKFAPYTISGISTQDLNYKTNSKLNLGAGVTYNNLTANLSYGFKFLNKDKGQGKTKGLDLQFHIFPKKWAIDVLGSFLSGYYLDPGDDNGLSLINYYQRPDIKRNILGFSLFRVLNSEKFSYKAAVSQSEWQTRSAGSLLYGGGIYYGSVKGDSAFVPVKVNGNFPQSQIAKINFFTIGIGGGYAYTIVISKNFFITGSAVATMDVNFSSEEKQTQKYSKTSIVPGAEFKGAVGYNSDQWSVSLNVLGNALYSGSAFTSKKYFLPTGNTRLTIAKRLAGKK